MLEAIEKGAPLAEHLAQAVAPPARAPAVPLALRIPHLRRALPLGYRSATPVQ